MPSQQDVANLAKVSFMTVSRVINNHPNVREETRKRVLEAIKELGYYPDATARALNTGKTKNIGVLFPHKDYIFSHPYFVELSIALEEELGLRGYHLLLGMIRRTDNPQGSPVNLINERKVDGIVLIAPTQNDPIIGELKRAHLPFILLNGRETDTKVPFVDSDNIHGTSQLMEHLFSLGHRRIGFVTGNMAELNAIDRYETYFNSLETIGIQKDRDLVYEGDWSIESGYNGFNALISKATNLTAIVFSNDHMALGGLRAAYEHNINIPGDISICGYDDTKYAKYSVPSLTTIHQPQNKLTKAAADLIISKIEKVKDISNVVIPSELIIRQSTRRIN